MNQYGIKVGREDLSLINITSIHPEPVEAFVSHELPDGRVQINTDNKARLELWIKDLTTAKKPYEAIGI
jgi:hypothetical protein